MCNACGNYCCGSDEFGGCGCDGCDEPDCWSDDEDFDDEPDYYDFGRHLCAPRQFQCVEARTPGGDRV